MRLRERNMAAGRFWCLFLVLFAFISLGCAQSPLVAAFEGDVVLGVVLPVHKRAGKRCSLISSHGIQAVLAISNAIHEINSRADFPPFAIGAVFLDDCNLPSRAAKLVMSHFQPDGDLESLVNLTRPSCPSGELPSTHPVSAINAMRKVVGIISGAHSEENNRLATVSGLLGIPMVSYRSPSRMVPLPQRIVNKDAYFLTSSPEFPLGESPPICELLRQLGPDYVTYVSIVTGQDYRSYLISAALQKCLKRNGICIAASLTMKDGRPSREYDYILDYLSRYSRAKYIIVIDAKGSMNVRDLFVAAKRRNLTGEFRWLDGSGWAGDESLDLADLEDVILGAITVQPRPIEGFNTSFKRMKESPSYQFSSLITEYQKANIADDSIDPELIYAREAVYAYAYALGEMYQELCPHRSPWEFCSRMWPSSGTEYQGGLLYRKLRGVHFITGAGQPFYFNSNGEGRTDLLLKQYKKVDGRFSWEEIGTYEDTADLETKMTIRPDVFQSLQSLPPSLCSDHCHNNQRKVYSRHKSCCWMCVSED